MIEKTCSRCSSNSHRDLPLSYPSPRAPSAPKRIPGILFAGIAAACLCLFPNVASAQNIEYRTLPELIESGNQALLRGDFPNAALAFNSIRENYSEEPAWLEGQLPAKILPLAGFSSHKANQHGEAISALEAYLSDFATGQDSEAFARYTLAASLLIEGNEADARNAFSELRQIAGRTAFRDLAILREAQLSDSQIAIKLLGELLADPSSKRLATFGRLRLIQLHLEQKDYENARAQLLDTPWEKTEVQELATLSLLATQVADAILAARPAEALRAYQLVQNKDQLVTAQQRHIASLKQTYRQNAPILRTEQSMWSEQFRQSILSLENQLERLQAAPEYSHAIALRKARCFSRLNRPLEAWILLEPIATSANELARDAHLEWISTAREMQAWNASSLIAQSFLDQYPNDDEIPQVLFWIALSQIEQESFPEAIESLKAILEKSPSSALAAASHYYLGYSHFKQGSIADAISSYQNCIETTPLKPIAGQAKLWIGICQFTTNELEPAIDTFRSIQQNPNYSVLQPEAAFRECACHYALGTIDTAQSQIESWIANYKTHPREAEAMLLYGDILTEQENLPSAIEAYASVETDDPQLTYLALQKGCALQLESGSKAQALKQLQTYRAKAPVPPPYIGSFTQLLVRCLEAQDAEQEIALAIQTYGDNLHASGIVDLIHLLPDHPETEAARPTLASRVAVAQIQSYRQKKLATQAKLKALDLASLYKREDLAPEALLEAGKALAEIGSLDAPSYFKSVLDSYPDSNYCDESYFELARHHDKRGEPEAALAFLLRTSFESPESATLRLKLELDLGHLEQAHHCAETLLADRQSTPTQKALALAALAKISLANRDSAKAYAYHQRIFTLYRGEADLVAQAYLACIQILSSEDRHQDALQVAAEFLAQNDLSAHSAYAQALSWTEAQQTLNSRPSQE